MAGHTTERFGGRVVLDNSAWSHILLGRLPAATLVDFETAVEADEILVCEPFRLEALYSAQDARQFAALAEELDGFKQAPCDRQTFLLAGRAQAALAAARSVSHRVKVADLLVAAAAHQAGAGILHYDHDFDTIAQGTDLSFRSVWLAPRGTL